MKPWAIVTGDLVRTGGMDRANLALAKFLCDRGHETHAIAFRVDPELRRRRELIFHRVPKPLNSYRLGMPLLARAGRKVAAAVAAQGGRVVVNGGNCPWADINWVHYVHHAYDPASPRGRLPRFIRKWGHRREIRRESSAFVAAARIVVNSNRTARDVLNAAPGVDPARVAVVYYGIDKTAFARISDEGRERARQRLCLDRDANVAIFVGALGDRRKGFDVVFRAWQAISSSSRPPVLIVAGAGSELNAWRRQVALAGLDEFIRLLGFRDDVPELLAAADLLVSPTRYEAYGLGVHEAICRGLPAIVSRSAGVAERYPADLADSLLLDEPTDAGELAAKVTAWRADIDGFRRRVAPFADALRDRCWDDMAADFVRVAESAVQLTKPPSTPKDNQ